MGTGPDAVIADVCLWCAGAVAASVAVAAVVAAVAGLVRARGLLRVACVLGPAPIRVTIWRLLGVGTAVAIVGSASAPALAAKGHHHGRWSLDWPVAAGRPAHQSVVVHRGDCLWSIATEALGRRGTPARVATAWPRWWQANRQVIGPDPDVVIPGERLRRPLPFTRSHT